MKEADDEQTVMAEPRVIRVGSAEINQALSGVLSGDIAVATESETALHQSTAYQSVLAAAEAAGFDAPSIGGGFAAGIDVAARLAGVRFEFLQYDLN